MLLPKMCEKLVLNDLWALDRLEIFWYEVSQKTKCPDWQKLIMLFMTFFVYLSASFMTRKCSNNCFPTTTYMHLINNYCKGLATLLWVVASILIHCESRRHLLEREELSFFSRKAHSLDLKIKKAD